MTPHAGGRLPSPHPPPHTLTLMPSLSPAMAAMGYMIAPEALLVRISDSRAVATSARGRVKTSQNFKYSDI